MRWKRLTLTEKRSRRVEEAQAKANAFKLKREARLARAKVWSRMFAWYPCHDEASGMVYWLEYVWTRAMSENQTTKKFHYRRDQCPIEVVTTYPWNWEYRGGKDAPEIKLDPGGL
jgi:hypothetical protein